MRKATPKQARANNRRAKRAEAKIKRQRTKPRTAAPTVPAKVAGAYAVQGQNLREVLFSLLDSVGGIIEVSSESIKRIRTEPLVIKSVPNEETGGYTLMLVDKAEADAAEVQPETAPPLEASA
jgi:hypothetical protein